MTTVLFTVASLALFFGDFRWWAPAVLAMGLLTFWRDGERLWHKRAWTDEEMPRILRDIDRLEHWVRLRVEMRRARRAASSTLRIEMRRIRREASAGLHFHADARTAWRTFRP